jgi:cytochrome c peroxidase
MRVRLPLGTLAALLAIGCAETPKEPPKPAALPGESFTSGEYTTTLPLGLQAGAAYVPENNPISEAKIELGRKLYFDARLSKDGSVSCATCHDPDKGFSDARATSLGIGRQAGARNAPTVMNRLFSQEQFWDGRAADLEAQALGPIENPIEMGHTLPDMVSNLKALSGYAPAFQAAFGSPEINPDRVGRAIATYERIVLAGNSPFDRYQAGEKTMLGESAVRGMALFNDAARGNCVTCHAGFNFTDESYHNLGVGMDKPNPDWGRFSVSKNEFDKGAFKTPTLRNVAQSGPYMHDGSEATLLDVVKFYDRGGNKNQWLSKEIKPLNLTDQDRADLVAFLESLTGDVRGTEKPTLP